MTSGSADLLGVIHSNPEYEYMRTDGMLDPLRRARQAIEDLKGGNTFWRDWLVKEKWPQWVRQEYSDDLITNKLSVEMPVWKGAIATVQAEADRLKRMHSARLQK